MREFSTVQRQRIGSYYLVAFSLTALLFIPRAHSDTLSLYVYPAPFTINWSTPQSLAFTTVADNLTNDSHPIGHINVELNCEKARAPTHVLTGMTTTHDSDEKNLLLKKEYGLGLLFYSFSGRLYSEQEIQRELTSRYQTGRVSVLTFKISGATCDRLQKYYQEYIQREYYKQYGLTNRPRFGEGAGCSAFGASFLDLAGLLSPELIAAWSRTRRVPAELVGGPLTHRKVNILELLFPKTRSRWARENEDHFLLSFWDPDQLFKWVQRSWRAEHKRPTGRYDLAKRGRAHEIVFDATMVPTPTDPIWRGASQ